MGGGARGPLGATCEADVATIVDLIDSVRCISDFEVGCMDAAQIPWVLAYPRRCNG